MYRRWGQAAPDAQPYSSYTEEEFHRAFARWQKKRRGKPQAPEIFVFFKHIDSASLADAGPQLQKVLDFRKSLEESRQVLYHGFANEAEFKAEVDRHLRAFAKGELPPANAPRDKVLLPLAVLAEVQKEKAEKEQALARAEREHQLAEAARVSASSRMAMEFLRDHSGLPMGEPSQVQFTMHFKNEMFALLDGALFREAGDPERLSYPADHPLAGELEEQMTALIREYVGQGEYLSPHAPEETGAHDDACMNDADSRLFGGEPCPHRLDSLLLILGFCFSLRYNGNRRKHDFQFSIHHATFADSVHNGHR